MNCEEIMAKNPVCLTPMDDARAAALRMRDENVGFLPVCEGDGRVVGTVTDRDIAVRLVAEGMPASTSVNDFMNREVIACRPGDDIQEAERRMARQQKSRMLVIDDAGKLAGVISLSDIVRKEPDPARAVRTMREIAGREARE